MKDFLIYYNTTDVQPLIEAIQKCFDAYQQYFGQNAYFALSLPSLANSAALNLYDQYSPLAFSFNTAHNDIRLLFRESIVGGLVNVYHRKISLNDDNAEYNAKYSPNGDKYSKILFTDANR